MAARPILYLHGAVEIGGAEQDLLALLNALDRVKWQPVVACPVGGAFAAKVDALGVPRHPMKYPPWRKVFAYARRGPAIRQLRALIERLRPALIHVNDMWWVPQAVQAAQGFDVPIVAHVRQEIEPLKARRYDLQRPTRVLAVSRHIEQALKLGGIDPDRLRTVYSGVVLRHPGPRVNAAGIREQFRIPPEAPLMGTVANLFPRKGYEVMLDALPVILQTVPAAHYILIGAGDADYEQDLRSRAQRLGVAERVHMAGFQESVDPFIAAMDLYVHPALLEGFGLAVIEAMALGKAVVASNVGGIPEIVEDRCTGRLVPCNDPAALAEAVVALLTDSAARGRMGEAGRHRVAERFTVQAFVNAVETVYDEVLNVEVPLTLPSPSGRGWK